MKTLLMNFRIMAILAVMCGFVSCVEPQPDEPDKPSTDVEKPGENIDPYLRADLLASMPESIEIKVETAALDSIAYICYESKQDALQASIIFLRGTKVKAESEGTVKITSLKADSRYYLDCTETTIEIIDVIRRQNGIVFPADSDTKYR